MLTQSLDDPEKSLPTKVNNHTTCRYSLSTQCLFDSNKNKDDYYRGKDCMKNFCENLKEHLMKTTNFKRLKILPSTEKEDKSHSKEKLCYMCRDKFSNNKRNS